MPPCGETGIRRRQAQAADMHEQDRQAVGDGEGALTGRSQLTCNQYGSRQPEEERSGFPAKRQEDVSSQPGLLHGRLSRRQLVHGEMLADRCDEIRACAGLPHVSLQ